MSYTKLQFINAAFDEIGMSPDVYYITPDQLNRALMTLDAMMAEWYGIGIRLGYPLSVNPEDSNLADRSNVPDANNLGVINNLAVLLGPRFGKTVAAHVAMTAKNAYDRLVIDAVQPLPMRLADGLPSGAGNTRWRSINAPFLPPPEDITTEPPVKSITFEG